MITNTYLFKKILVIKKANKHIKSKTFHTRDDDLRVGMCACVCVRVRAKGKGESGRERWNSKARAR